MLRQTSTRALAAHAALPAPMAAQRAFHTAGALCTASKALPFERYVPPARLPQTGLELAVQRHVVTPEAYNQMIFGAAPTMPAANPASNTQLSMRMLQQQLGEVRKAKSAGNLLLSPVNWARSLQGKGAKGFEQFGELQPMALKAALETDYAQLLQKWAASGDVALEVGTKEGVEAGSSFARAVHNAESLAETMKVSQMAHMVKLPFPLHEVAPDSAEAEVRPMKEVESSLSFRGYLAPRFTSPSTPYPNFFYDCQGAKRIARMMVKSGKMWYVEGPNFQMVDVPYLQPGWVATFILPRGSADRTIQDHPQEFEYDQAPRVPATVDEVVKLFATPMKNGGDLFSHYAKHMSLMNGLVGLPGFTVDSKVGAQRAVLTLSPHGLDVGVKTPRQPKGRAPLPNFTALFDHPFVMLIRSTDPAAPQIAFAAVVQDVMERTDFKTRFPLPSEWRDYKEQQGKNYNKLYQGTV